MIKITLFFVAKLANSELLASFYALLSIILAHFSFVIVPCENLYNSLSLLKNQNPFKKASCF